MSIQTIKKVYYKSHYITIKNNFQIIMGYNKIFLNILLLFFYCTKHFVILITLLSQTHYKNWIIFT